MKKQTVKEISAQEFCLEFKLNNNTRDYMVFKYKENRYSKEEWKRLLKKDGLKI